MVYSWDPKGWLVHYVLSIMVRTANGPVFVGNHLFSKPVFQRVEPCSDAQTGHLKTKPLKMEHRFVFRMSGIGIATVTIFLCYRPDDSSRGWDWANEEKGRTDVIGIYPTKQPESTTRAAEWTGILCTLFCSYSDQLLTGCLVTGTLTCNQIIRSLSDY
jgi:hypothetical protein